MLHVPVLWSIMFEIDLKVLRHLKVLTVNTITKALPQ